MIELYKVWHEFLPHFSKISRCGIGTKIDFLFLDALELLFIASYLQKDQKLPVLRKVENKLDISKFFLQITWQLKIIDTKKYIRLSSILYEIGKMLGGWIKSL